MGRDARFDRADRLFDAALGLPAEERAAFLDRECGDDVELRTLVERLLTHVDATAGRALATGGALAAMPQALDETVADLRGSLLDRYRIAGEIGRGGMGVVYRAHDEKLDRPVALKVLSPTAIDEKLRQRFLREARAAATLNHPNVVAIHDAGEADGRPFLVMELVSGPSLDARPPQSLEEALRIAGQICDALEHAHDHGLVHRDLKPGNVLVSGGGRQLVAKLTDMGIALARGAARVTRTGAIAGTPTFMAPEQALGQELDGRADLYALGVMLYAWAAGRPPFDGEDALAVVSQHINAPVVPPRTYRPDLPAGLEPLILRLLSKDPDDRFASAAELRDALEKVGTEEAGTSEVDAAAIAGLARGRMVGRQRELEQLQGLWRAALAGHSHLALISGEPGVGKTRLARELTATAQIEGALLLAGGCYENEATTPYLPFVEAFRKLVSERGDDALREALGDTAQEIARLAPEIESRLGPFGERPSLSPQEERLRLFDHVARFLRNLAGARGLVLFVDDLQWADHGSLALLHYLMRQLTAEPVLFLGTYREVELDRAHALSKSLVDWNREHLATRIKLDRLSRDDTARMVATMLGQHEVSQEFIVALHDETEGNPFFVEEIVKALVAEGGLVRRGNTWQRRKTTGEFVLPQSVKAAIGSRLSRIGDACSDVLRTAAVLGKVFEFAELASVAREDEEVLLDALDEAAAAQLIVPGRRESFSFTHDKIREVLYEELNPIRRRRLHARIAGGLERLRQRGGTVSVEELAYHYVESGDYEQGLRYAGEAAAAAQGVFAFDEALEMLTRARECAEALERQDEVLRIDETMGDAAFGWGDLTSSTEHYERALTGAGDDHADARNRIRGKAGEAYVASGDPRGLELAQAALRELDPERMPAETAQARMVEARYLHLDGKLSEAAERYRAALALLEPLGESPLLIRLYSFMSGTLQHMAEFEESDAFARRCLEHGERLNAPEGTLLGHEFLSENAIYRGYWDDCVRHGEAEEALALETHASERYAWSHFRAWAVLAQGRIDEAERLFRRAIAESERIGERRLSLFMRMGRTGCMMATGRIDRAAEVAERATRESDEWKLVAHRITGRAYLIRARLLQGRQAEAARLAREAVDLWAATDSRGIALIYGATLAEGLIHADEPAEVLRVLDVHRELAERTSADYRLGQNRLVLGLLALHEERHADARTHLDDAVAKFEATGSPLDQARALAKRSQARRVEGDADGEKTDLERARELVETHGASPTILELGGGGS